MNCDICGEKAGLPIPEIPGSFVCISCGFVHVKERRSSREVAKAWDDLWDPNIYSSSWPGVVARQNYVAEFCDQAFGWRGKDVLDIGAGEGDFLTMISERGARVTGLEPSTRNCDKLRDIGIDTLEGTIQDFHPTRPFDVVTLLWTLENTGDCMDVLIRCRQFLKDDGIIVVATGSRILVPYKKPFSSYVSELPPDLHCFRFSYRSLWNALKRSGFEFFAENDDEGNDALLLVGAKRSAKSNDNMHDDPQEVLAYFKAWKEAFP